jgi:hypothetical protein
MALDSTMTPGVFQIKQNGSAAVVSGTTLDVQSGGVLRAEDGGVIASPVTVQATTSGTITNFGLTTFGTTIASAYTLAAPHVPGIRKTLACTIHGASTVSQVVTFGGSATALNLAGGSTAAVTTLTFTEHGVVELVSATTSQWLIVASAGNVTIT